MAGGRSETSPESASILLASPPGSGGGVGFGDPGGDEDMMQDFVRLHMMSILHPFAQQIRDLQAQVHQLTSDAACAAETAGRHDARLGDQAEQLAAMTSAMAEATGRLDAEQADLASLKKEKNRLEGNHEMTKATVGKTKDSLQTLTVSVEGLQQALCEKGEQVQILQATLVETDKRLMEYIETRLNKQGKVCKELSERQAEMSKSFEKSKTLGENTSSTLKKFMGNTEQRRDEDAEACRSINNRMSDIEAKLQDWDQDLKHQASQAKLAEREIQHLKTWAEQVEGIKQLSVQQSDFVSSLKEHGRRLTKVEEDMAQVRSHLTTEKQMQITDFAKVEDKISKQASDISRLKETQKIQGDMIGSAAHRVDSLESDHRKVRERTESTEQGIHTLTDWQGCVIKKLDTYDTTFASTCSDLRRAHERIDESNGKHQSLRDDFGVERDSLAKISSRLDLCCKYFNGLGKGLQETHRQVVAGESGILPPKMSAGSMLPAIPQTPKTPRSLSNGKAPSPRKIAALPGAS